MVLAALPKTTCECPLASCRRGRSTMILGPATSSFPRRSLRFGSITSSTSTSSTGSARTATRARTRATRSGDAAHATRRGPWSATTATSPTTRTCAEGRSGRRRDGQMRLLPRWVQGRRRKQSRRLRHPAREHGLFPPEARRAEHQLRAVPRQRGAGRGGHARSAPAHARVFRLPPAARRARARGRQGSVRHLPRSWGGRRRRRHQDALCLAQRTAGSLRGGSRTASTGPTSSSVTGGWPARAPSSAATATRKTSAPIATTGAFARGASTRTTTSTCTRPTRASRRSAARAATASRASASSVTCAWAWGRAARPRHQQSGDTASTLRRPIWSGPMRAPGHHALEACSATSTRASRATSSGIASRLPRRHGRGRRPQYPPGRLPLELAGCK